MAKATRIRAAAPDAADPNSPRRKWRAITLATLVLVPAYWFILAGVVSVASDSPSAPEPGGFIAAGLALVPFAFLVLAFLSDQTRAPGAVVRAMVLSIVVGLPVSALAADAVTGFVAGAAAGGAAALRPERPGSRARITAVLAITVYSFLVVHSVPPLGLLLAPALPFTAIGLADHLSERRRERRAVPG